MRTPLEDAIGWATRKLEWCPRNGVSGEPVDDNLFYLEVLLKEIKDASKEKT